MLNPIKAGSAFLLIVVLQTIGVGQSVTSINVCIPDFYRATCDPSTPVSCDTCTVNKATTGKDQNKFNLDKPSPSPSPDPNQTTPNAKKKKRGEFVIAPIPISSPAIGSGLVLALGYIFQVDKNDTTSAPSVIGALGMRTNNGSRAAGLGGSLHFKKDQYRIAAAAARFDVNVDFFGVGHLAGNRGIEVPFNFSGKAFLIQGFYRVHPDQVYVGARFQIRKLSARLNREGRNLPDDIIDAVPGDLLQADRCDWSSLFVGYA